ncbi:hypothetical protein ACVWXM_007728 [Bradyrhizobium sp. GM7.3]
MRNPASSKRRGQSANAGDLSNPDPSAPALPATTHTLDPLTEPIEIAKFWKSARNRTQSIVISIKHYEGHTFLDCRLFGTNAEGRTVPTGKGVTVGMARLPEFASGVAKALAKARELGLIDGAGE